MSIKNEIPDMLWGSILHATASILHAIGFDPTCYDFDSGVLVLNLPGFHVPSVGCG